METFGDATAYLTTTAQIVPVLALAMVLEARFMAGRLSKQLKSKKQRPGLGAALYGLWLSVTCVLLLAVFWNALSFLTYASTEPLADRHKASIYMSFFVLINAAVFVIFVPARPVISALGLLAVAMGRDRIALVRWRRWTRWPSLDRTARQIILDIVRERRFTRLRYLSDWSAALVKAAQTERRIARFELSLDLDRSRKPSWEQLTQRNGWSREVRDLERAAAVARLAADGELRVIEEGTRLVERLDQSLANPFAPASEFEMMKGHLRKLFADNAAR